MILFLTIKKKGAALLSAQSQSGNLIEAADLFLPL